jgi:nitrile hydratase accessory protein
LSQPDSNPERGSLAALQPRRANDDGPVFAEPWQAGAFALAVVMSENGYFTQKEWAAALGSELRASAARGEPDDGSRYYDCWLAALERLLVEKQLSDAGRLQAAKEAWVEAYRHTPHGKPVELDSNWNPDR